MGCLSHMSARNPNIFFLARPYKDKMDAINYLNTSDMRTTDFEGKQWVDVSVEWQKLPDALKASSDKWARRLSKLRIPVSECRFTHTGDITKLSEPTTGGKKSVYVLMESWNDHVRVAMEKAQAKLKKKTEPTNNTNDEHHDNDDDDPAAASGEAMCEIPLTLDEHFVYNNVVLKLRAYGDKTPDDMYVNFEDAVNALAIRRDNVPSLIELNHALVDGEEIVVISYDMLITLICIKAKNFPVAKEMKRWITHVTHAAQYNTDQNPMRQAEFASRHASYKAKDYGLMRRPVLYLNEVCSAHKAYDTYPDQIKDALPEDANMAEYSVFKGGFSLNELERIGDVRSDLKVLFPGCDPRPVHSTEFPSATKEQLEHEEGVAFWHDFDAQRIRNIKLRGRQYTELLILNHSDVLLAKTNMNTQSHLFVRSQLDARDQRALEAETRVKELEQEKLFFDLRMAAMQEKQDALEIARTSLQSEVDTTRRGALTVMPKEAAAIASAFWGMCAT